MRTPILPLRMPSNSFQGTSVRASAVAVDEDNGNSILLNLSGLGVVLFFSGEGIVTLRGGLDPVTQERYVAEVTVESDGPDQFIGPLNAAIWNFDQLTVSIEGPATVNVVAYSY